RAGVGLPLALRRPLDAAAGRSLLGIRLRLRPEAHLPALAALLEHPLPLFLPELLEDLLPELLSVLQSLGRSFPLSLAAAETAPAATEGAQVGDKAQELAFLLGVEQPPRAHHVLRHRLF